ncbi:hypothetical protein [Botrimarina sp.]|uniref:hypothetical protein n=1 Tax=Botrimarina sp. TaxID=2795802 RepID=UPI0032EB5315
MDDATIRLLLTLAALGYPLFAWLALEQKKPTLLYCALAGACAAFAVALATLAMTQLPSAKAAWVAWTGWGWVGGVTLAWLLYLPHVLARVLHR